MRVPFYATLIATLFLIGLAYAFLVDAVGCIRDHRPVMASVDGVIAIMLLSIVISIFRNNDNYHD